MIVSTRRFVVATIAAVGLSVLGGCATPEKPKELKELERILKEDTPDELKEPPARKYYEEARKLRESALDVLEDEHAVDRARHYAVRGKLRYRTAEAVLRQLEAKKEVEKANAKIEKINPQVQKLAETRNDLRADVRKLHQKKRKAEVQQAQRRRQRIEAESSGAEKEKRLEAQNNIERALEAKREAIDAGANEFAKGAFNRAQNELESARTMADSESYSEAATTADSAKRLFEKASKTAKEQNPERRMQDLRDRLSRQFGSGRVESTNRGVRVIMTRFFDEGSASVLGSKRGELEALGKLAKEYDEFEIRVDGYTSKGDPTDNLSTSQLRAKNVADFFKSQGVSGDRISTDGKGQSNRRYSSPSKNERVEVTFIRDS